MSESRPQGDQVDDDHWEIYVTFVDEKPAIILVDIGVSQAAPLAGMGSLVWLSVLLQSPDEEGFPTEDEDDRLNDVEDSITESLGDANARYVGRISSEGRREFFFYTSDPDRVKAVFSETIAATPDYQFEIDEADDAEWTHYWDVLYPSPEDFQQIHNDHVINRLQQEGDTLTQPRPVDHFANFKTNEDREAFSIAAAARGFETVSRPDREDQPEFPCAIGLIRIDPVDAETIDEITFELFALAQEYNGEYEGWGSKVVKS